MANEDILIQTATEKLLDDIVDNPNQATFWQVDEALSKALHLVERHRKQFGQIEVERAWLRKDCQTMLIFSAKLTKAIEGALTRISEIWPKYAVGNKNFSNNDIPHS